MNEKVFLGMLLMSLGSFSLHAQSGWEKKVNDTLPLFGHRNWIVVVDSAYPLQSSPGVDTIETSSDQLSVLSYVLDAIKRSKHVRPIAHGDMELNVLTESEAPGVSQYRERLKALFSGIPFDTSLHQKLIEQLAEVGKDFHVLVLKTNITIPYSSVFLQLDCKYWSSESEARLRQRINASATSQQPDSKSN